MTQSIQSAVVVVIVLGFLASTSALAHSSGENYVWINAQEDHLDGRFTVRLDDLRNKLGIELPTDYEAARQRLRAGRFRRMRAPRRRLFLADWVGAGKTMMTRLVNHDRLR